MATELLREEEGLGPNGLPPSGWSPCDSVAALSCFCPLREERVRKNFQYEKHMPKEMEFQGVLVTVQTSGRLIGALIPFTLQWFFVFLKTG